MLVKGLFDEYEKCLQDEPAATTARCPVHVDVPELCREIARGDFQRAYTVLQKRIPFAGMFCLVCDAVCEQACVRAELDEPVRIGELERAAVRYGRTPFKKKFKTSKLAGKVAVVGGGISGLAASFDLDRRGFEVTLFEQGRQLGGWLWNLVGSGLEAEDIKQELEAISELAIEVHYGQFIDKPRLEQLLVEYDAVYLGTGVWEEPVPVDPETFRVGPSKLFAGGSLINLGGAPDASGSLIGAVSSGKRAAVSMERLIKKTSLTAERARESSFDTLLPKSLEYVEPAKARARSGAIYTREEAREEAARCLLCECDECVKACAHIQRYGRKPKTYAREIYTNENVFMGTRYANKMINSCTLCGLCGERCHLDICMAPLVRQTRLSMVANEKMPPSAHDFALRDMAFSNSEQSALVRQPPHFDGKAPYLFFPGCQLAASEPEHIEAAYEWLRETVSEGVALALGCCGAPADWAARNDLLKETLIEFQEMWEDEGRPTLILACSSCKDVFSRCLPDIPSISLWQLIAEKGVPDTALRGQGKAIGIHDACSTREDAKLHQSVRSIIDALGYEIEELRYSGEDARCCGYGGGVFFAHREQERDFALCQAQDSAHDLVVYCAMCKDLFVDADKRSLHLLDLLFAGDLEEKVLQKMPSLSERQVNRAQLKRRLLRDVWGEDPVPSEAGLLSGYSVHITTELLAIMDERLILVSDVEDALSRALDYPDERFYNTEEDCYLINIRKQYVTYWVRYKEGAGTLEVLSAYSHRMDLVGQ